VLYLRVAFPVFFSTSLLATFGILSLYTFPAFEGLSLRSNVGIKLEKILDLLDLKNDGNIKLIQLCHFFLLEVLDLFFCLL
jgi:hypothetical protein